MAEDSDSKRLLGTAAIFLEKKFHRNLGIAGHIEDVVVDSEARGRGIGNQLTTLLTQFGQARGCYKVILDCLEKNAPFYEKAGYKFSGW